MNLLDLYEQREPYQQAIDRLEQSRIDTLNDRMQELLARARTASPEMKAALKREFEKIKSERDGYYKIRETQKGQDVVDRTAKMKALTPSKPGAMGAIKDVASGLKNFLQGKPETGPTYEAQKKNSEQDLEEHGGGIGPSQRWQDLMPEQYNHDEDYEDEEETDLRSGDYVRDTMDGEHGEIFRMQGDPYERRVRILDRDGKGWYIEPSRLTRVDPTDPDVQRYFGKKRVRDMDESDVAEGWSDAYVSRRTGRPRTPYSVYINGKKWKDFANDDHARAVMDKLKAKFAAGGRDPNTVTIAPTDIPEGVTEDQDTSGVEQAILKRIMVAHLDLLRQYGPEKIMQAAEEVAYNVGDVDEIGSSDVSAYVNQVKQILGAVE